MRPLALLLPGLTLALMLLSFPLSTQTPAAVGQVVYKTEVYFDFGTATLSTEAMRTLDSVAKQHAGITGPVRVRISGHTDSVGSESRNLALSQKRAFAVQAALESRSLAGHDLTTSAFGETEPAAPNHTEAGRRLNRRAVVEFLAGELVESPRAPQPPAYSGQIRDKDTGKGIPAIVHFNLQGKADSVRTDSLGHYTLPQLATNVQAYSPGHYFNGIPDGASAKGGQQLADIVLEAPKVNDKLPIKNLNFVATDTVLLPESLPELPNILRFMQMSPDLKVEIAGHVSIRLNAQMTTALWNLSENRAKVVYDYLLANGIPASRMSYKGYGNTEMPFPDSKNEDEDRQNRRVEIRILKN